MKIRKSNYYILFLILIIVISNILIFINSGKTCAFVDYTYQVENAYRIYLGQVPYKDFFLGS